MSREPDKEQSGKKPVKKKKLSQCIDLDPQLPRVNEDRDTGRVDFLIKHGLGDPSKITYYRRAIQDPRASVASALYREYVGEVLDEILDLIFEDQVTYNRIRTQLMSRKPLTEETGLTYDRVIQALRP